ncbi:ribokinase [Verrucomicrobia bacterium]|nr:ribokinase [Verrucomicrobiota bacterium]
MPSTSNRILVIGSSNTDMIIKLDRLPRPGETLLGGQFATAAGGKGANQAVAAARAGGAVTFVAKVGNDSFGQQAITGLKRDRINVDHVFRDASHPSGVALIFVAKDGENSIAVASGTNSMLRPADLKQAGRAFRQATALLLQLETPIETVHAAAKLAAKARLLILLNPAPARRLPRSLLRLVSILTPNETEAEMLTGVKVKDDATAKEAAARLVAQGVRTVVMTLGARGALILSAAGAQFVAGFKVKAVDCTAAGDVFNGALAVALTEGQPLANAVRFANSAAAISVTRLGAQPSAPTRREIDRFLQGRDRAGVLR